MGSYHWLVGDFLTGKISHQSAPFSSGTFTAPFDEAGALQATWRTRAIKPTDPAAPEWPEAYSELAEGKGFLGLEYVDGRGRRRIVNAGLIWDFDYSDAAGTATVGASGLLAYYAARKLVESVADGVNIAELNLHFAAADLALIAKRVVQVAHQAPNGEPPVILPDDEALGGPGTAHERNYPGYELGWVGERLQQLSEVIDGPEIQFEPRRRADDPRYIEWVMRIGTYATSHQLHQAGRDWVFDYSARRGPVSALDVKSTAQGLAQRAFAAGEGEGEGRPIARVTDTALLDAGYPLLEAEATGTDSVSQASTLVRHAQRLVSNQHRRLQAWVLSVESDFLPSLAEYRTGDWCLIRVADHDLIPDGEYRMRIGEISGDAASGHVQLTMLDDEGSIDA